MQHLAQDRVQEIIKGRRSRILYFIVCYPNFSETYMHEEIRSLRGEYDIKIITYNESPYPRRTPFPYELIKYGDWCLVYSPIQKIDRTFGSEAQQAFLRQVYAAIEEFKPDILHAHYLGLGLLLSKLAERYRIPFTIRTHSMDLLSEPPEKLRALCQAANSPWCLRVLAFPAFRERFVDDGFDADKVVSCWPVINFARFYKPTLRPPTGRVMCAGPCIAKKAHTDFVDLAARMRGSGHTFDLYAQGPHLQVVRDHNDKSGNVVNITYADPDDMPDVYPRYDWLVYTSDRQINKVGFPASIAEAQASGIGVCWQELPDRRQEQLEFLGGAGFLFRSIHEVPAILARPYPENMRLLGFDAAKRCDIEGHKELLTGAWDEASARSRAIGNRVISMEAVRSPSLNPGSEQAERLGRLAEDSNSRVTRQPRMAPSGVSNREAEDVRLALVTCVQNESELIWANLHYHHSIGVEKAYVFLDDCSDDTPEIVRSIPWAEPILIERALSETAVFASDLQRCCMDESLKRARKEGFEWLLMIDPDEYAFADNPIGALANEHASVLSRADLRRMLAGVPSDIALVRLRTVESVPCLIDEGEPFWQQRYFQDARVLKREILDPRTGESFPWDKFLAHREGKAIVRTAANVQSYDPHRWVMNQGLPFPRSPAYMAVPTLEKGLHFHFWAYNRRQFRDKYRKLAWAPKIWPCGNKVEHPKQCWKELSVSLSEMELDQYLSDHVFLQEHEVDGYVSDGVLIEDSTVKEVLEASHFRPPTVRSVEGDVSHLGIADVCPGNDCKPPRLSIVESRYEARDFMEPYIRGVYLPEFACGRYLRWTGPEAEIQFQIDAVDCLFIIDMDKLGHVLDPAATSFEINDHTICSNDIRVTETAVAIAVSAEMISESSLQSLRIHTRSLDWNQPRDLGMPIFAVLLEPLNVTQFDPAHSSHSITSWLDDWLSGFHPAEKYGGKPFRWTRPEAGLRLRAEPGDYVLVLNLGSLQHLVGVEGTSVKFNGQSLHRRDTGSSDSGSAYSLPRALFEHTLLQTVEIISPIVDTSSWDCGDPRRLGIPLFGIDLQPVDHVLSSWLRKP